MTKLYCSQCKHSKYIDVEKRRSIQCLAHSTDDEPELLPVSFSHATQCPDFQPEKAGYKSRKAWLIECKRAGLDKGEVRAADTLDSKKSSNTPKNRPLYQKFFVPLHRLLKRCRLFS